MKDLKDYGIKIICSNNDFVSDFAKDASKITKMTLKLIQSGLFYNNNWIIANPNSDLNIIPLIAYLFKETHKKDVMVLIDKVKNRNFSRKIKCHVEKLSRIQIGDKSIKQEIVPFIKSANRDQFYQNGFNMDDEINPNDAHLTRIIFSHDLYDLSSDQLKKDKYMDKKSISLKKINLNLGLIIIENLDIFSDVYYESFVELLRPLVKKNVKIIVHFSNPFSKYISRLTNEINANTILYDSSFYIKNKQILFNPIWDKEKFNCINHYELDNRFNYDSNYKIAGSITLENIDFYYEEFLRIEKETRSFIRERNLFLLIKQRFIELYNLAVHPNDYTFSFFVNQFYHNSNIDEFIDVINSESENLDDEKRMFIMNLLSNLNSFYLELKNTARYSDTKSFSKESKNYFLMDLLKKQDCVENSNKQYTIIGQNIFERKKLFQDIYTLDLKHIDINNIQITTIQEFSSAHNDCVIVPGCPNTIRELAIILNNSREVLFITYEGLNNKLLEELLSEIKNKDFSLERKQYFTKLFKELEISQELIPSFLEVDLRQEILISESEIKEKQIIDEAESEEPKLENEYKIRFIEMKTKTKRIRSFNGKQRLLTYDEDVSSELKEVRYLKKGDIVLDIDGKRNVLEIMCNIYELNSKVDLDSINEYYNKLLSYQKINLKLQDFYDKYVKFADKPKSMYEFRYWIKQAVIGPESSQDIKSIGLALGDDFLTENYEYIYAQIEKIRANHIQMGRKLKRIVKNLISKNKKDIDSFEDLLIINHLSFFDVRDITKIH